MRRLIFIVIWTLGFLVIADAAYNKIHSEVTYVVEMGKVLIDVDLGQTLVISQSVTFEAASDQHFIFQNRQGSLIESRLTQAPLAWEGDYHLVEERNITQGEWSLMEGNKVVVSLVSESEIAATVRLSHREISNRTFGINAGLFVIWLVGGVAIYFVSQKAP